MTFHLFNDFHSAVQSNYGYNRQNDYLRSSYRRSKTYRPKVSMIKILHYNDCKPSSRKISPQRHLLQKCVSKNNISNALGIHSNSKSNTYLATDRGHCCLGVFVPAVTQLHCASKKSNFRLEFLQNNNVIYILNIAIAIDYCQAFLKSVLGSTFSTGGYS